MFYIEPEVNVLPIKVDVEWMIFDDFVVCVSQPGRRLVPPPGELYQTYRRRIDWLILSYYVKNMTWRHSHNRKYMTYCISSEFGHAVFEICERIDTQTRWSQYVAPLVGEVDVEWMSCSLWRCEGSAGRLGSPCLTGRRCIGSHVVCTANNLCQCDNGFFVKNAQCREFSF